MRSGADRPSPLWESNPRHQPYHGCALPTELRGRGSGGSRSRARILASTRPGPIGSTGPPCLPIRRLVKCQRVIIEAGGGTFTLDLHPRLSVIAGLGPAERDSLIGEIIGALGGNRPGVHLELRDATGRHLAVFRPKGERHRVIDVTSAEDVSHEFVSAGSQIDLLSRSGLDANTARHFLIVGPNDFATVDPIGERITLLAAVDQRALWAAADRVTSAADDSEPELAPTDGVVETPEVVDKVEELHDEFEAAVAKESQIRRLTYRIAAGTAVAAVPAAFIAPVLALPLLFATGASMAVAVVAERRIARASPRRARGALGSRCAVVSRVPPRARQHDAVECRDTEKGDGRRRRPPAGTRRMARRRWRHLAGMGARAPRGDHRGGAPAARPRAP